jgi:multiple sugar transport system permease protein
MTNSKRDLLGNILTYLQVIVILAFFLFPVYWMISNSFHNQQDILTYPPRIFTSLTIRNFETLFNRYSIGKFIINSFVITGGSTLLGMLLGVPAAFAAAKWRMENRAFLNLLARMTPGTLFLIPWYMAASWMHLIDNYLTLIVAHTAITMPIIMYLMLSFFKDIPEEIFDAGLMDGCSKFQLLSSIGIPLTSSGLSVSIILAFIFSWNYFLFCIVLAGSSTMPLTIAAFNFIGTSAINWGGLMAAATIISLPPIVLLFFIQKWLLRGLTVGAVKG